MNEIDGVPQLDAAEAHHRVTIDEAILLDVREQSEWDAGHAPNAVHIPLGMLGAEHASKLGTGRPIVAVCRSGGRSHRAAAALRQAGYDASNLAGGMQAWAAAGNDVVTDDGRPGQVA